MITFFSKIKYSKGRHAAFICSLDPPLGYPSKSPLKVSRWDTPNPMEKNCVDVQSINVLLGGGFKYFFMFIPIWGNDPILTNIFQMGWNHQLVFFSIQKSVALFHQGFRDFRLFFLRFSGRETPETKSGDLRKISPKNKRPKTGSDFCFVLLQPVDTTPTYFFAWRKPPLFSMPSGKKSHPPLEVDKKNPPPGGFLLHQTNQVRKDSISRVCCWWNDTVDSVQKIRRENHLGC